MDILIIFMLGYFFGGFVMWCDCETRLNVED